MGVCKVISERSVLYVFTFSRRTFDHPFGSSDRRSILRGIRSCGSYRRCRRLTFRTSDKIATLEADFSKYASDFVKLNELTQEKEAAEQQLEEKMERWMYLEDLAARIERGEEN